MLVLPSMRQPRRSRRSHVRFSMSSCAGAKRAASRRLAYARTSSSFDGAMTSPNASTCSSTSMASICSCSSSSWAIVAMRRSSLSCSSSFTRAIMRGPTPKRSNLRTALATDPARSSTVSPTRTSRRSASSSVAPSRPRSSRASDSGLSSAPVARSARPMPARKSRQVNVCGLDSPRVGRTVSMYFSNTLFGVKRYTWSGLRVWRSR